MKPVETRLRLVAAAVMFLVALPSFAAPKRRAVNHPSAGAPFSATIRGTVVDASSNLPVAFAVIEVLNTKIQTSREGTFEVSVNGFGTNVPVIASRTGYNSGTLTIGGGGTHTLNFRLQSRPTVSVRLASGTTLQLDDDSIKTGYVILFSGYVSTSTPQFCKPDGTRTTVNISDIKRFNGPSNTTENPLCCTREGAQLQRIGVTLRNGETGNWTFNDSCAGYSMDLLGRDHTTGDQVFLKFSDIAEVVFP